MKHHVLAPRFVEHLPDRLDDGLLYVCEAFQLAAHKCCCGCGEEVITPLNKAHWDLRVDGDEVSLHPSIGNWNFKCKSHYWIRRNKVIQYPAMSASEIGRVQKKDRLATESYIQEFNEQKKRENNWRRRFARWILGR